MSHNQFMSHRLRIDLDILETLLYCMSEKNLPDHQCTIHVENNTNTMWHAEIASLLVLHFIL